MKGINVLQKGRYAVIDVNQKNKDPINGVLTTLNGNGSHDNCLIDFTSLKPGKLENELFHLFEELPNQQKTTYVIALPEKLVAGGSQSANEYDAFFFQTGELKRAYIIANKKSAQMMLSQ